MNAWTLHGKRALVTGAGRGIGAAIVGELLGLGAAVFGVSRTAAELETLKHERFHFSAADLTVENERKRVMDTAVSELGGLDILVNNAGIAFHAPALESALTDFDRLMELNVKAAFHLAQLAHPFLKMSPPSSIINVSSVVGLFGLPDRAFYGASKAALDYLTTSLAVAWGKDGIRVNSILPWFTKTLMTGKTLADISTRERILSATPLGRVAEPEDIARAVAFLALPASAYITGQRLAVDGGFSQKGL
jgi:tropinone reductase I